VLQGREHVVDARGLPLLSQGDDGLGVQQLGGPPAAGGRAEPAHGLGFVPGLGLIGREGLPPRVAASQAEQGEDDQAGQDEEEEQTREISPGKSQGHRDNKQRYACFEILCRDAPHDDPSVTSP
jgi:hypothetical protein